MGSWYLINWSDMHTNGSCFVCHGLGDLCNRLTQLGLSKTLKTLSVLNSQGQSMSAESQSINQGLKDRQRKNVNCTNLLRRRKDL